MTPTIKYNSVTFNPVVGGVSFPTPYVSRSKQIRFDNDVQVEVDSITLNGSFYIKQPDDAGGTNYTVLKGARDTIIQFFAQNNKKLETDYGTLEPAMVRDIHFDPSNYSGMVTYSVTLEQTTTPYVPGIGSGTVVDMVDEYSVQEEDSGVNSISHKISAKGIETSITTASQALESAKTWVRGKLWGVDPVYAMGTTSIAPSLGMGAFPLGLGVGQEHPSLVMTNEAESINRLAGTYSVTETYSYVDAMWMEGLDQLSTSVHAGKGKGMLTKYSIDTSFNPEEMCQEISVNITVNVGAQGRARSLQHVREYLDEGSGVSKGVFDKIKRMQAAGYITLEGDSSDPASLNGMLVYSNSLVNTNVNLDEGTISLGFKFDNNRKYSTVAGVTPPVADLDAAVAISTDYITGITTVTITGELLTDPTLSVDQKNEAIDDWFNTYRGTSLHTNLHNIAKGIYMKAVPAIQNSLASDPSYNQSPGYHNLPPGGLNPVPSSLHASANKTNGTGNITIAFSDEDYITDIRKTTWNVQAVPSIVPYEPKASVVGSPARDGHYIIFSPGGVKRARWNASLEMEGAREYPVSSSTFNIVEQRIRNNLNLHGTDIIKESDAAGKVHGDSISARSSFSYSLHTGSFWNSFRSGALVGGVSISQQIWPILSPFASPYTAMAVIAATSDSQTYGQALAESIGEQLLNNPNWEGNAGDLV